MALIFVDGFDSYMTNADLQKKYTSIFDNTNPYPVSSWRNTQSTYVQPRFGAGQTLYYPNYAHWVTRNPIITGIQMTTVIVGFAVYEDNTTYYNAHDWIEFVAPDNANVHNIGINGAGQPYSWNSVTGYVTGTSIFPLKTWVYVEAKITLGNPGTVALRWNGQPVSGIANPISQRTNNATWTYYSGIRLGMNSGSQATSIYYDDLYVCDGTGSVNNDFLGDVRVSTLYPQSQGTYSSFASPTSGSHVSALSDLTPDYDASYLTGVTPATQDTYLFSRLPTGATVKGVQETILARKDDAGAKTFATYVKNGASEQQGVLTFNALDTYTYYLQQMDQNPALAVPWTPSNFNSSEFGIRVVS